MASFVRLIEQFAIVLYLACLAGVAWSIRSAWQSLRERGNTLYALEREAASARAGRAALAGLAFVGLGFLVFLVAGVVAPALPAEEAPAPTPPGPLITLTPSITPFPTPTTEFTATPQPSPNATAIAVETPGSPTPPPARSPAPSGSCPDPRVQITAPGDGDAFSGPFQVFGTANIENFGFYKFVLNGPITNFEDRTTGDVFHAPVVNSYLGTLDPAIWLQSPGAYRLSLVAVDNVGNEAPHCTITLQIQPPTPAP